MKNKLLAIIMAFCVLAPLADFAGAQTDGREIDAVLTAAETFFVKLRAKEYKTVWGLLTEKSQETIVKDTDKSLAKSAVKHTREEITADFNRGGPVAEAYWQGYLSTFDPDTVLSQSAWSMGLLKKDRAEINLLYKKAEKPAVLKMSREKGVWKVGLVEAFWSRNPD
ncbi:MAG: hypothetical protein M0P74_04155 [Syntrophales bacterium]|jgi:hypothetical protein|nr:hypothetical protein [Syntrophales bacterium]